MPIAVANMTLPTNISSEVAIEWLELLARKGLEWGHEGWGGHGGGSYLTYVNPLPRYANLSDDTVEMAAKSMRDATDFVLTHRGVSLVEVLPSWSDGWAKYIKPQGKGVGTMRVLGGRLWPQSLFETGKGREAVIGFTRSIFERGIDPRSTYIPIDSPFLVPGSSVGYDTNTSTHPAWYSSLWNYGAGLNIPWNSSYGERLQALVNITKINEMAKGVIGTHSGAYVHETNPFTRDWKDSFWGSNYPRLLDIKKTYDPDMLLSCWKCVGFEDSDVDSRMFECQGKLQSAILGNNTKSL